MLFLYLTHTNHHFNQSLPSEITAKEHLKQGDEGGV